MVGAVTPTGHPSAGRHRPWPSALKLTASTRGQQRWVDESADHDAKPSNRRVSRHFRAQPPTPGGCSSLIVPSVRQGSLIERFCSRGQIVATSSDTQGVTGQTVNYFCPILKGAKETDRHETDVRRGPC